MKDLKLYFRENDKGEPVPTDMWTAAYLLEAGDRRVAKTIVPGGHVSTVFIPINHNYASDPDMEDMRPLVYETMVFGGPLDGWQDRYSTRAEALRGHWAMVGRA